MYTCKPESGDKCILKIKKDVEKQLVWDTFTCYFSGYRIHMGFYFFECIFNATSGYSGRLKPTEKGGV